MRASLAVELQEALVIVTATGLLLCRGPNYFEVDVDITANTVAASVTSLVVGAITSLVVDLCVLVEGQVRVSSWWWLVGIRKAA